MIAQDAGAVIVAAGRGMRMGGVDKCALALAGRSLLGYSVRAMAACVRHVVIVVAADHLMEWTETARRERWPKPYCFVTGGETRMESVRAGVAALMAQPGITLVAIHDGARPLVTPALVRASLDGAARQGAAILAVPVTDTIKRVRDGLIVDTPDRTTLWAAQTPQAFRLDLLRAAYAWEESEGAREFTDEAGLIEAYGQPVAIVRGARTNLKITEPDDLVVAEALMRQRSSEDDE